MAIEELPDTVWFQRVRIPLSDFVTFPGPPSEKNGIRESVPSQHPSKHFRSRSGFYIRSDCYERFAVYLKSRPAKPSVSSLFVWTLKQNCVWGAMQRHFEGKNQPVPWWVIQPLLKYVASGNERVLLTSEYETPFFMEANGEKGQPFQEVVSLELTFGTLHSEWWLKLLAPGLGRACHLGQSFLSVA